MSKQKSLIILGIETSCDETAVSVAEARNDNVRVLSNAVSSQTKLHAKWGGVVPNLAAREHLKNIIPVLELAFKKSGFKGSDVDLIAATQGPGLIPALLIGANAAKTLAYVWQKPLIGIHHIEGHIYANFIRDEISVISNFQFPISKRKEIKFPILCLVVSGGHTQLILMKKHLDYEIVGETVDDAAGEAFDKAARILGLGYPGGPAIAACAANFQFPISSFQKNTKYRMQNTRYEISLSRPMINSDNLNMSFSGLKTAVLYEVKKIEKNGLRVAGCGLREALAREFQQAVIDVLISKTLKAAKIYKPKTVMLAGGVSANQELRKQLKKNINKNLPGTRYLAPDTCFSIDNAAMIAAAGFYRWKHMTAARRKKSLNNWKKLQPDANLKLE